MANFSRRVSLFVLVDKNKKLLLQHRDSTAKRLPLHWAFFGGGIEEGETPEDALAREAKEELQIELINPKLFKRYVQMVSSGMIEKYVFIAQTDFESNNLKKQQQEGDDLGFFSYEEIRSLKISDNDLVILRDLFGHL